MSNQTYRSLFVQAPAELVTALDTIRRESGLTLRAIVVATMSKAVGLEHPDQPAVERELRRYRRRA